MEDRSPGTIRGKSIQAMTTEELEELLRAEQDAHREPDVDLIREVLAALDTRTEAPSADVDAAWDDFKTNYMPGAIIRQEPAEKSATSKPKQKSARTGHILRIALVTAAVAVLIFESTLSTASGFNLWKAFVSWTGETLGLKYQEHVETPEELNPELHDLNHALIETRIKAQLAPRYLPDGYKQTEILLEDGEIAAQYEKDGASIIIQFFRIQDAESGQFQRDNGAYDVYSINGIDHFISTNLGNSFVVWVNDGWECSIIGVPSAEELLRMINSIYLEDS